ncbi:c-type cytochrome [Hymenobacter sp. BT491]|uniref:c-type cytochrome n=1 Tax=Hymenobacter sp. BT491 TaxID=2766779 RepID=UPI001653B972|nr:cytochrome c [Hymenobacter sp. BT491]MBC6990239.1 cytochrome c [Hymenobacter sp. BT491]
MKKALRILLAIIVVVLVVAAGAAAFVSVRGIPTYEVPKVAIRSVVSTPALLANGEKIAMSMCADCHLDRKANSFSGRYISDLPPEFGKLYSANITQDPEHGIGKWTDAELITLFRTGIGRDGRFRIVMPQFVHMSDEDINSLVVFLRSNHEWVQPKAVASHAQEPSFLGKVLVNTVMKPTPMPAHAIVQPNPDDKVAFGHYLVTGRYLCYDCHSKDFQTNNILEPERSEGFMAGGNKFITPNGETIFSRNLTAEPETGIGDWSEEQFVKAVKFGQSPHGPLRLPMPKFSVLSDEEVKAMFAYLQTIPKLRNATAEDGAIAAK